MSVFGLELANGEASAQTHGGCARCAARDEAGPLLQTRHDDITLWGVLLAGTALVAVLGEGTLRWIGLGAFIAVLLSVLCALYSVTIALRAVRAEHEAHAAALVEDGDSRVATVIRQFEWAVNDVVHLKRQHERAEAAVDTLLGRAQERERYIRTLEDRIKAVQEEVASLAAATGEPGPFAAPQDEALAPHFRWAIHHDGFRQNMELETVASSHRPIRLRIVDAAGEIVMTSGTPMRTEDGAALFSLSRPPAELVEALESGAVSTYVVEAFIDYEWRPVTLEDSGRRTRMVADKQGRSYRVTDTERMLALRNRRPDDVPWNKEAPARHDGSQPFAQLN